MGETSYIHHFGSVILSRITRRSIPVPIILKTHEQIHDILTLARFTFRGYFCENFILRVHHLKTGKFMVYGNFQ